jgi:hypothetical protein
MALKAMLNGWQDHFITLTTLIDLASDQHRDVQHLAVTALVQNWLHHPKARTCLGRIAESSASFPVKYLARQALYTDG